MQCWSRASRGLRWAVLGEWLLTRSRNEDEPAGDASDSILRVSRVRDEAGNALDETGRSVASMQFMITKAMKIELTSLGYSRKEIDSMEPSRAAAIIAHKTPSSRRSQRKRKSVRERFELQFTCNVCEAPNSHSISWHAYNKGTVLVTCPGCQTAHLIADNLNWLEDDFKNLESYMAKRGTPVRRIVTDGSAASSARGAADHEDIEDAHPVEDARRPWRGTKPAVQPLDGITDEQAMRIRDAVRQRKRRQRHDE
ncbi:MAG: hypothetical protein SGPRY_005022 [Prymnesium sp.]